MPKRPDIRSQWAFARSTSRGSPSNPASRPSLSNAWIGPSKLHLAVGVGASAEAVQLLLEAGADPNARAFPGLSVLHWAVKENTLPDVVQAFFAAVADPNLPDAVSVTLLHRAAGFGTNPELVQALFSAGANPDALDRNEKVPFDLLSEESSLGGTRIYRKLRESQDRWICCQGQALNSWI
ncbi:MAG: ankyrin repeat domain-containing protein [Boseongicola sp. SB0662_bin_57]|nr:ankyrin repeat domain-containing protein [Boseongicola sp. SB0662_bin_57]